MPKLPPNEPWHHEASGFWCKKVAGKLHYLDHDYKVAKRKLRRILDDVARGESPSADWLEAPFSSLADEFLTDIKACQAAGTYRNYREQLLRAMKIFGATLPVGDLIHAGRNRSREFD